MFPSRGCLLALLLLSISPLSFQNSTPASGSEPTTFRSNVRVVLVDVVVTNAKDEPVTGLPKDDFQILEDGHPQTLASFDEHAGLPDFPALALQARLPPNVFSNLPLAKTGDAANVLLLDSLNTPMQDQSYVHAQMLKYIKEIHPGTRLAIFTLGTRLRFVQGFTGDPAVLMAALNGKKTEGNPQLSPLIQTGPEADASNQLVAQMEATPGAAAAAAGLQSFLAETASFQTDVRIGTTLDALQQLARSLEGIPGRKNVIWFSSSFPIAVFGEMRHYEEDNLARTANLLAAAQIAIYPIGAEGVAPDHLYDFSNQQPPRTLSAENAEQQVTKYQTQDLQRGSIDRDNAHAAMDKLAADTGGKALYNTNGLNEALDRVLNDGTHYYTLAYSPTNKNMDGRERRIEVKLSRGSYHLAYRRGYYATDAQMKRSSQAKAVGDPLRPLMDHGTPDSTEILYAMHVAQSKQQPAPGAIRAGDNENLKGAATRYTVNFTLSPEHLALEPGADGVRHGNIEATLLAYDRDGKPLNWIVRMIQVDLTPERYAAVLAKGLSFALDFDVPAADVYLRSGVYDQGSTKAGTLEIPLGAVVAQAK